MRSRWVYRPLPPPTADFTFIDPTDTDLIPFELVDVGPSHLPTHPIHSGPSPIVGSQRPACRSSSTSRRGRTHALNRQFGASPRTSVSAIPKFRGAIVSQDLAARATERATSLGAAASVSALVPTVTKGQRR